MSLVVHPYADAFPMMSDDKLDALADDIKVNGLLHPIIRDKDGRLVDGRNRLAACKRAGIEPRSPAPTSCGDR
jgi:ParB-like chromosome segregation protein Spo0J